MRHVFDYIKNNRFVLLTVFLGLLVNLLIILPSGSYYCYHNQCGYFFWGAHGHDAVWHLAIATVSFKGIGFIAPTYSGASLSGYNFLLDYVIHLLSQIGISPLFSYFKLFPVIWFILFTVSGISFARKLKDHPIFVTLFLFFMYFGSSFSYLISLMHTTTIWGSANVLAMQSAQALINLQYAFSLVIIFWIFNLLLSKKYSLFHNMTLGLLMFLAFGMKFYGGVISTVLVSSYLLLDLIQSKNIKTFLIRAIAVTAGTILSILLFYDPIHSLKTGAALTFSPLSTVHPLIEDPTYLYLKNITNARYFLQAQGRISPRLFIIEAVTFLIYLFFNFGIRLTAFVYFIFALVRRKISKIDLTILAGICASIFLSTFFVQKGIWWNTVQFLYYGLFFAGIYTALFLFSVYKKNKGVGFILIFIFIAFSLPANIDLVKGFATFPASSYIPIDEIHALNFLKNQKDGVVFTPLYSQSLKGTYKDPQPLYAYDDTSYVSAFSGKQSYFANIHVLEITGIDYQNRLTLLKNISYEHVNELPITYIYLVKQNPEAKKLRSSQSITTNFKVIFDNRSVIIYARSKE